MQRFIALLLLGAIAFQRLFRILTDEINAD